MTEAGREEEQAWRGGVGGDAVFQRKNAENTISDENHLETLCLLFPKCTIIKDSLGPLHNKGTRMVDARYFSYGVIVRPLVNR